MASERFSKASEAAKAAQSNPYIQRLVEDAQLRDTLRSAYGSARSAYGRMSNGKPPTQALFEDKKLQQELKQAIGSLRDATESLREAPASKRRRRRGGFSRTLLILSVGGLLAIALNEGLRSKVLDLMFGAEEQFDYTSTTSPATPEPAAAASA